jgi:hypothetical protein
VKQQELVAVNGQETEFFWGCDCTNNNFSSVANGNSQRKSAVIKEESVVFHTT